MHYFCAEQRVIMAIEIERKFLVAGDYKARAAGSERIVQGYLASEGVCTVRVRIRGERAFLTVKGPSSDGIARSEWEYAIPVGDAMRMLALCRGGVIDKRRYLVPAGRHTFEVDEFYGDNEGLTVAEVELASVDEPFERPEWIGAEVTGDRRYYNSHLVRNPYKNWK